MNGYIQQINLIANVSVLVKVRKKPPQSFVLINLFVTALNSHPSCLHSLAVLFESCSFYFCLGLRPWDTYVSIFVDDILTRLYSNTFWHRHYVMWQFTNMKTSKRLTQGEVSWWKLMPCWISRWALQVSRGCKIESWNSHALTIAAKHVQNIFPCEYRNPTHF